MQPNFRNTPPPLAPAHPLAVQAQIKFQQALAFHQKGQLAQAQALYTELLTTQPRHADALHLLGVIAYQTGDPQRAVELIGQAIALNPNNAAYYSNHGNALKELRQLAAAIRSYDKAIAIKRDFPEASYNRGNALKELGQLDAAIQSYDQAIALRPGYAEAHSNRGIALNELKQAASAVQSFDRAIALQPGFAQAHYNRGLALQQLKQFDAALASYEKAIALKPDYAQAYSNRGVALQELGRGDAAIASYDQAIALKPDYAEAYFNRGVTLQEIKQLDAAVANFNQALALQSDYADAAYNRGIALQQLRQLDAAVASYDRAIAIRPDYAEAYWNKSLACLLGGDFAHGWDLYEWRWTNDKTGLKNRDLPQPLWLGQESLADKTILLHSEQGFGDTIQFCRYIQRVAALGARVLVEVEKPLFALLRELPGISGLLVKGDELPAFDFHCPMPSLPLAFKTELHTIPCAPSYLSADSRKVTRWAGRSGSGTRPRVGLVWSSVSNFKGDASRSVSLAEFVKALPDSGLEFVCLQKEIKPADRETLDSRPDIRFYGHELHDFSDTAALIESLDLVVSTCTSVPHLSGALGKPTWILLSHVPDWRWLLDRDDSPWYPSVKLYRQPTSGDWDSVFARVKADLSQFRA